VRKCFSKRSHDMFATFFFQLHARIAAISLWLLRSPSGVPPLRFTFNVKFLSTQHSEHRNNSSEVSRMKSSSASHVKPTSLLGHVVQGSLISLQILLARRRAVLKTTATIAERNNNPLNAKWWTKHCMLAAGSVT
jgi:hypothetical protein